MTPEEIAEREAATAAAKGAEEAGDPAAKKDGEGDPALHSDPVKAALDKESKKKRPEIERAAHSLKKNAERLKELGGNPAEVLGTDISPDDSIDDDDADDDKPVTRGDLKRMELNRSRKTALQLADTIQNSDERNLAKLYLKTRIVPSDDPEADLNAAMAIVNFVKNAQVHEEIGRQSSNPVKRYISGSGNPARREQQFEASAEEISAARIAHVKPENQKQWILDRRDGKPVVFGTAAKKRRELEAKNR